MTKLDRELLLNWLRAKGAPSSGVVEGPLCQYNGDNKVKLATRKSYGFRTCEAIETALYHNLEAFAQAGFHPQILVSRLKTPLG